MHKLCTGLLICAALFLPILGAGSDHHKPGRRFLLQQPAPDSGGVGAELSSLPDVMLMAAGRFCGAPCAPGYYCSPENNTCVKCQRGFMNNEVMGTKKCWRCEHGWTTTDEGATTCPVCLPGFGGPTCIACPPGSFSLGLTEDHAACQPCANPTINECQQACDPRTGTSQGGFVPNGRSCKGGRGSCWRGKCVCPAGFQGDDCSKPCAANTTQNGRMSECAPCRQVKPGPCVEVVTCTADKGNVMTLRPPGTPCRAAGIGRCSSKGACDVDACAGFPCTDGEQGGVATCADLPPPAPNDASGRSCSCGDGFTYAGDAAGCVKA